MNVNHSIIAGVYVLSTKGSACIVDAVAQVSGGDNPLIAVSVNKNNYTNKKITENDKFILSVLPKNVDGGIISRFGFNSSRDMNKFEGVQYKEVDGINVIENCIGYMILEKVNSIDCETHTLFIGRLIKEERYTEAEELVYQYYQRNKEEYIKLKINNKTVWVCTICGYVYEGDELPKDFRCPKCGVGAELFEKKNM